MQLILKSLQTQRKKLVTKAEAREEYFSKRKESWQISPTGSIYNDKTGQLADVIFKLDNTIEELKTFLNDC